MTRLILSTALLLLMTCAVTAAQQQDTKPNIILILADDLGYGELGCYGQTKIKTPHLDKIAAEGIKFSQFYSGQTVCAPSRCSLLTGRHQGHAQIRENSPHLQKFVDAELAKAIPGAKPLRRGFVALPNNKKEYTGQYPLKAGTVTLGTMLQGQGYKTACVGKWGLGHPFNSGNPNKQGFDFYFGYICQRNAHSFYPEYLYKNDTKVYYPGNTNRAHIGPDDKEVYSGDAMEVECLNFIKENKDNPFFLYYANPIPHLNLQVPEKDLALYRSKDAFKDDPAYDGKRGYIAHPTPRAAYAGMVTHMDNSIGKIMALLKELNIDDNTLVIFTSDNGPTYLGGYDREFFNGAGELKGHKGNLYEGGIRVPTVMRWPGKIAPGRVSDHVAAFWDFMPTLAEISNAPKPDCDGLSFLNELQGKTQNEHDHLYWEFYGYGGWQVVRKGDWKAIRKDIRKSNMSIELYNLKNDVSETTDLAAQYPEVVAKMAEIMKQEHLPNGFFPMKALGDKKSF